MLKLIDIETIKSRLLTKDNNSTRNFPRKIGFEFPEDYKILVTNIKTVEISAECNLFDSVESVNSTKEFSGLDYWNKDFEAENIKDYWFFGANGQGDLWIMHKENKVYFYDHNTGEISNESLIDLNINFGEWLQFAFLNKELEEIYLNGNLTREIKGIYKLRLNELSNELAEKYPFEM